MTISGGPDQSIADPGTRGERADDPVVLDRDPERLDGDDITVEPDAPRRDPGRRFLVAAIVLAVAAAGIGTAVALSHRSSSAKSGATSLRTVQPTPPLARPAPAKTPVTAGSGKAHPPAPPATVAKAPANAPTPATNPSSPVLIPPPVTATPPPAQAVTPPPPPPVTAPPAEPASVLRWTAKPGSVSVKGGARTDIVVTVVNPTRGTVTLPVPLSCAPTLRGPHGAYFGQSICEQLAQLMSAHQQITQRYTIYATTTGDPSGQPLAPGVYTARIENLFAMKVTVTAS